MMVFNGCFLDDSPESPNEQLKYYRQESSHARMSQNSLRALVRESWENTGSFSSFQRRLAPNLNDKYCMSKITSCTISRLLLLANFRNSFFFLQIPAHQEYKTSSFVSGRIHIIIYESLTGWQTAIVLEIWHIFSFH